MPNKLYVEVEVYDLETDNLLEKMTFDYNNYERRKEYLKLFHRTIVDEKLGIDTRRVASSPRAD